ncbi:MAG: hypothetical protein FWF30_04350, partial [Coriobacteriia bacterium]|nr:hypothetical protein [Coriobacteriia bacterium]
APLSSAAPPPIRACSYAQAEAELPGIQVLIDATTLGMQPGDPAVVSPQFLHSGLYVLDLVYAHGQTALVTAARAAGAQAEDGLGVLVEQAALALEFWCAQQGLQLKAPRSAMRAAVC